jgi:hypothetical protein
MGSQGCNFLINNEINEGAAEATTLLQNTRFGSQYFKQTNKQL